MSRERRVKSSPLTQGERTSPFGLPLGFSGSPSHARTILPSTSNAPPLVSPMNATPAFSLSASAFGRSDAAADKSEGMVFASLPSSLAFSDLSPKHTNDT